MGDQTIGAIDRIFNVVDATLDEASNLLGRTRKTAQRARQTAEPSPKAKPAPAPRPVRARIIESTDAQTGASVYVVTDGVTRSECNTRELAERVLVALEYNR